VASRKEKKMDTMSYGQVPERKSFIKKAQPFMPYDMTIRSQDEWAIIAAAINQGIDSRLEGIFCDADESTGEIVIHDPASLHTLIRRLSEDFEEDPLDFAACILHTIGYEWI